MILSQKTIKLQKSLSYKEKANKFLLGIKKDGKERSTSKIVCTKSQPATKKSLEKNT
jgi:hypothetical protein